MPADSPFALVEAGVHGLRITAVNACARAEGVRVGQALADARAALPSLMARPGDTDADAAALNALARWCGRYGPQRNVEDDDGLWIDVSGVAHLFGGEAGLVADLSRRLAGFGFAARIGLADTPGAAHALARYAPVSAAAPYVVVAPGRVKLALADLPVGALRLSHDSDVVLCRLGLKRIGQLYGLPRVALARRFRDGGGTIAGVRGGKKSRMADAAARSVLLCLDQALGRIAEPRAALGEPPLLSVRRSWADPLIAHEGIETEVRALADDLVAALVAAGLGCRRVRLSLYRSDGTVAEIAAGTSRPCRDGDHILALLTERLANTDAGFGVDVMRLDAVSAEPVVCEQAAFSADAGGDGESGVARLVDKLANRLGPECITYLAAQDSHIPERAQRAMPALDGGFMADVSSPCETARSGLLPVVGTVQVKSCPPIRPRPLMLLDPPEPIAVMAEVPEGAPLRFTWRRVMHSVRRAEGPERIAPEWWRGTLPGSGEFNSGRGMRGMLERVRDYYRVEVESGARYWIFRAGLFADAEEDTSAPGWFVHGLA